MKFFFGILLVAFVALASAEEAKKELKPENSVPVSENESAAANRDRRSLFYGGYAAPIAAAPIAAAPIAAAPIAASPIVAAPFAAAPVAVATPVGYSYSASVRYPYAGYRAYSPYVPAVYL